MGAKRTARVLTEIEVVDRVSRPIGTRTIRRNNQEICPLIANYVVEYVRATCPAAAESH